MTISEFNENNEYQLGIDIIRRRNDFPRVLDRLPSAADDLDCIDCPFPRDFVCRDNESPVFTCGLFNMQGDAMREYCCDDHHFIYGRPVDPCVHLFGCDNYNKTMALLRSGGETK